jgi:threonylcarbamoyladenosine tRNA methylthiotransferase MtaB
VPDGRAGAGPAAGGPAPPGPVTVAFATLGCKLNQADTAELQALLEARGLRTVPFDEPAQLYVVNTCTVTARADRSDRQAIRRAVARNPGALVVVTGCYAQTSPEAVAAIPGVDAVLGTADRGALPEVLESLAKRARPLVRVSDVFAAGRSEPLPPPPRFVPGYTRAFVKVQDGCQHRCSFCVVPYARGGSRSQPPERVVAQVVGLAAAGYREVVLTGVDLGHYGWDLAPRDSLAGLLRRLLEVPGPDRLRVSSILPAYFTDELVDVLASSPRLCRHLHVPLQSGSDRVLRAMRRPYTVALFRRLVERLAARIPDLGLGTDVITGFPGETAADFAQTEAVVAALPFTYLHVFSYSDRRGTEAARSAAPRVPPDEVRRRTALLRRLGAARQAEARRRLVGRSVEVLVLERGEAPDAALVGLTDNYLEVAFAGPATLRGRFARVRVTGEGGGRLRGEHVGDG